MAQELDIRELKRHRRNKKRKRLLKKMLAVLLLLLVGILVYITRERWIPFFDGIATRYLPTSANDGELAQGNFPIEISGFSDYKVGVMDNAFAVLNETNFALYSPDGKKLVDNQHNYSRPVLHSNNRKALIYDIGGVEFRLESKYKTVYTKKMDNSILLARLSDGDKVAVVTASDNAICDLTIFDGYGEQIYKAKFYERILDVTFSASNEGCLITALDSSGGQLVSRLERYSFTKDQPVWTSSNLDTLVLATRFRNDGSIVAIGDTKAFTCDNKGEVTGSYTYESQLIDYVDSGSMTALLFANEERRRSGLVLFSDIDSSLKEVTLEENAKRLHLNEDKVLVMTDRQIYEYTSAGTVQTDVDIGDMYTDFRKLSRYIFLLGDSEINRIDFAG